MIINIPVYHKGEGNRKYYGKSNARNGKWTHVSQKFDNDFLESTRCCTDANEDKCKEWRNAFLTFLASEGKNLVSQYLHYKLYYFMGLHLRRIIYSLMLPGI